MPSERFLKLRERVSRLQRNLVPKISDTGDYTEEQLDMVAGFRLLAHAEIEAFLEESAREVALSAIKAWHAGQRPGYVLACLLSHYPKHKIPQVFIESEKVGKSSRLEFALQTANAGFNHTLMKNNGIREENIRRILFPIGVKHAEIDSTWLNTIDSFGVDRGTVAHNAAATIQAVDPQTEIKTLEQIMQGLETLDDLLMQLH